jgi:hypothetical protein
VALILLPARALARRAEAGLRRATAAYFLLVGAGFMFTEIAAMQRLVLLFGHPVYAFAATLAAFLVFAGLGSGAAARLDAAWPTAAATGGGPAGSISSSRHRPDLRRCTPWPGRGCFHRPAPGSARSRAPSWPWRWSRRWPSPWGCPSRWCWPASRTVAPALVPWAWGVNGCASVVAAALAGLLAMGLGARALMLLGVLAYLLAAVAQRASPGAAPKGMRCADPGPGRATTATRLTRHARPSAAASLAPNSPGEGRRAVTPVTTQELRGFAPIAGP